MERFGSYFKKGYGCFDRERLFGGYLEQSLNVIVVDGFQGFDDQIF
jgi:hypothetical protein